MQRINLTMHVFYAEREIENPAKFVIDFIEQWKLVCNSPLKLYQKSTPYSEITQDLLDNYLFQKQCDKTGHRVMLTLKSSLKKDNDIAHFMFESSKPYPTTPHSSIGWKQSASSGSISIPINKINKGSQYNFSELLGFFYRMLSYKKVSNASISLVSPLEFELDIHEKIFNAIHTNDQLIFNRRLEWATFFTMEEFEFIIKTFQNQKVSFEVFCEHHRLTVQNIDNAGGILLSMIDMPANTPEYFQRLLTNNQDFYEILAH